MTWFEPPTAPRAGQNSASETPTTTLNQHPRTESINSSRQSKHKIYWELSPTMRVPNAAQAAVTIAAMTGSHADQVPGIYRLGIDSGHATFETEPPGSALLGRDGKVLAVARTVWLTGPRPHLPMEQQIEWSTGRCPRIDINRFPYPAVVDVDVFLA
jgi:hypothetical protein